MEKSIPIYISFCISKNTEVNIEEEPTDLNVKKKFMETDHYRHLKMMLYSAGFFIDDFNVIVDELF